MASSKNYLELILGQLSGLEEITYRAMMGEFLTYYRGKLAGGIYNDRLLVKPKKAYVQKKDAVHQPDIPGMKRCAICKVLFLQYRRCCSVRGNPTMQQSRK